MKTMEEMLQEQINNAKVLQSIVFTAIAENDQVDIETMESHKDMIQEYQIGVVYKAGQIRKYNGVLYKVVQDHTSQADWSPANTPSLYEPIGLNKEGYPVWSQPSGAHDAYNTGDIVDYNGTLYKSLIDGNVYSPEAYPAGWEVFTK